MVKDSKTSHNQPPVSSFCKGWHGVLDVWEDLRAADNSLALLLQLLDVSFDNMTPVNGPMPSPVASQMSNISNSNKFFKMIGGRDQWNKTKGLKAPHGQAGFGSVWTQFEDQALVVLVRDLDPNWELIAALSTVLCNSRASFASQENAKSDTTF